MRGCTDGGTQRMVLDDTFTVGKLVLCARKAGGLTQAELAARAGVAQPNVSRVERDAISPSLGTVERLVRACGFEIHVRLVAREGRGPGADAPRETACLLPGGSRKCHKPQADSIAVHPVASAPLPMGRPIENPPSITGHLEPNRPLNATKATAHARHRDPDDEPMFEI